MNRSTHMSEPNPRKIDHPVGSSHERRLVVSLMEIVTNPHIDRLQKLHFNVRFSSSRIWQRCPSRKFGHTQGVLKRKLIPIADFKIRTVLDWENPGYGNVARVMSAKPPALAKFKSPIVWEQIWQKYLDNLYIKTPISVLKSWDKPRILGSTPESTINAAFKAAHDAICQLQRDIFHFAAEKCAEDDFERKWRVAGPKVQETCYFEAIKRICNIPGMEKQRQYVELCSMPSWWASIIFFSPQVRSRDQPSYFPGEERAGLH